MENGLKVVYLQVLKALYGSKDSSLLCYNMYTKTLKSLGFIINTFERCIASSVIDAKQCKISWYVDDNKVSHVEEKVNTKITEKIVEHFGELTVSRGAKHKLLGMDI